MTKRLTPDQEAIVADAISSGVAASAEAFVTEALQQRREAAQFDQWVRDVVVPAHHEFMKDPSQGKTADETLAEVLQEKL